MFSRFEAARERSSFEYLQHLKNTVILAPEQSHLISYCRSGEAQWVTQDGACSLHMSVSECAFEKSSDECLQKWIKTAQLWAFVLERNW